MALPVSKFLAAEMWEICWWRSQKRFSCGANLKNVHWCSFPHVGISVTLSSQQKISELTPFCYPCSWILIGWDLLRARALYGKIIEAILRQFSRIPGLGDSSIPINLAQLTGMLLENWLRSKIFCEEVISGSLLGKNGAWVPFSEIKKWKYQKQEADRRSAPTS